jgi:FtsH-binding integral membrane protein
MHGLFGVTISPLLIMYQEYIPPALIITTALMAGSVSVALRIPNKSLLPYSTALYTCLWGLLGAGATSLIAPAFGYTALGATMHDIDIYGGIAFFTLYSAYDTHKLIYDFEQGQRSAVEHATQYSVSYINVFIRVLEHMGKKSK